MDNLIYATGWSVLHALWISAFLYGVLQLSLRVFSKASSATRYYMAYVILVLMFAGFLAVFILYFRTASPALPPLSPSDMGIWVPGEDVSVGQSVPALLQQVFPYLVSGYGAGLVLQLLFFAAGLRGIRNLRRKGLSPVPDSWQSLLTTSLRKLKIRRKVRFFLSERITGPLVTGFLKPMVLFPVAMASQLDLKQTELILLHELEHIRRHDYLFNLVQALMEAVLFFSPFVWLCGRIIRTEREYACDDQVVRTAPEPLEYARTLYYVAAFSHSPAPLAQAVGGRHTYQLLQRIKRMTTMEKTIGKGRQPLLAVLLALVVAVSLAWIRPAAEEKKVDEQKEAVESSPMAAHVPIGPMDDEVVATRAVSPVSDSDTGRRAQTIPSGTKAVTSGVIKLTRGQSDSLSKVLTNILADSAKVKYGSIDSLFSNAKGIAYYSLKMQTALPPGDSLRPRLDSIRLRYFTPVSSERIIEEVQRDQNLYHNSPEILIDLERADSLWARYFPVWKEQVAALSQQATEAGLQLSKKALQFKMPTEFSAKLKEQAEFYHSKEYRKLKEKFDREVEALRKKKQKEIL